jgi:hypothetical protein
VRFVRFWRALTGTDGQFFPQARLSREIAKETWKEPPSARSTGGRDGLVVETGNWKLEKAAVATRHRVLF